MPPTLKQLKLILTIVAIGLWYLIKTWHSSENILVKNGASKFNFEEISPSPFICTIQRPIFEQFANFVTILLAFVATFYFYRLHLELVKHTDKQEVCNVSLMEIRSQKMQMIKAGDDMRGLLKELNTDMEELSNTVMKVKRKEIGNKLKKIASKTILGYKKPRGRVPSPNLSHTNLDQNSKSSNSHVLNTKQSKSFTDIQHGMSIISRNVKLSSRATLKVVSDHSISIGKFFYAWICHKILSDNISNNKYIKDPLSTGDQTLTPQSPPSKTKKIKKVFNKVGQFILYFTLFQSTDYLHQSPLNTNLIHQTPSLMTSNDLHNTDGEYCYQTKLNYARFNQILCVNSSALHQMRSRQTAT